MNRSAVAAVAVMSTLAARPAIAQSRTLTVPTFGRVVVYAPAGAPASVVLFVSGDGGWNVDAATTAERLRAQGALVVGIDIRSFVRSLEASQGCAYPAGDLEELSRNIQLGSKLPVYKRPLLVGYGSGAALVYAAAASAPPETFAGTISLGFCPYIQIRTPLCEMRGLKTRQRSGRRYDVMPFEGLNVPWMVLNGEADQVCSLAATRAFVAATGTTRLFLVPKAGHGLGAPANWEPQLIEAYRAAVSRPAQDEASQAPPPAVADLPLVEVPAKQGTGEDRMAVILTGDGGWAELDKAVAAALAADGVPTVGWSSLRYFWTARTPEHAASDLARIITHYTAAWKKDRVALVGYSFGADVLPFLVTRLPQEIRARVAGVTLLGLAPTASFEFHLAEWLGGGPAAEYRTVPEVERLTVPVTCVHGAGERDSACPALSGGKISVVNVGEGHHFSGEYRRLAEIVLRQR